MTQLLPLLFLFGAALLSGVFNALTQFGRFQGKILVKEGAFSFYAVLFDSRKKGTWEELLLSISSTKSLLQLLYAATAALFYFDLLPHQRLFLLHPLLPILLIILVSLLTDFTVRLLVSLNPNLLFRLMAPFSVLYLYFLFPLTFTTIKLMGYIFSKLSKNIAPSHIQLREKLIDILDDLPGLEIEEQKLILSVASFKGKIARGVMMPRTVLFSLPGNTPISAASKKLAEEGYSRVPVSGENRDHIIGILFLKDIFKFLSGKEIKKEDGNLLSESDTINHIVKPITSVPETKKISELLQDFRQKRQHMAIVVNEFGGTEGIITLEDIIEELLGEIADEYDDEITSFCHELPDGTYEINPVITIDQYNEILGETYYIAPSNDYATLGGFLFEEFGSIPAVGSIHESNTFVLRVVEADGKKITKVHLSPATKI